MYIAVSREREERTNLTIETADRFTIPLAPYATSITPHPPSSRSGSLIFVHLNFSFLDASFSHDSTEMYWLEFETIGFRFAGSKDEKTGAAL